MKYGEGEQLYVEDFAYLISSGHGRKVRSICPLCYERRSNKRDKSLSIDTTTLYYRCFHCDAHGFLKSKMSDCLSKYQKEMKPERKIYRRPVPKDNIDKKYADSFLEYFKGRGISEKTLRSTKVTQDTAYFPSINKKAGCIAFNYFLEDELINVKYRTRNKDFTLEKDAELIPYNVNSIAPDSFEEGEEKYCIFCEGEIDCLTWIECGYTHAVSVPNGANENLEYIDKFVDSHFDKLDVIYIAVDNDYKGLICREELIRRFGKEMCRVVDYPKPCKDINEVLLKYGKDAVIKCLKDYTEMKPDGIEELTDVENELDVLYHQGLQKGTTIGVPEVDKILSFRTGMLNIVTGVPTSGKTYFLNYVLARLNILNNWKVAFFSPEFYPVSLHISQVIETLGGRRFSAENYNLSVYEEMKRYVCDNFFWIDPDDTDLNSVLDRSKYLIKKKGIKALVIDPFNALTDKDRKNVKQDEYISDFLQKLRWFARKYGVAVFLVMHPVKQQKLENGLYPVCDLYSCKGAAEINDKADVGISIWRNEFEDYAEMHVVKMKFRHLGEKGHTAFKFNLNNGRYVSIGDADALKKSGADIKGMTVTWDNSNWVIEKLKGNQIQQSIPYEQPQEQPTQPSIPNDMPFAPMEEGEAPF